MATTWVRREDFEAGDLPHICITTGAVADGTVPVRFDSTPSWTWILLLFGVFPFLIATMFATERVDGEVPVVRSSVERYHRWRRTGWGLVLPGILAVAVGWMATLSGLAWTGLLVVLAGVALLVASALSFVDGRPDDSGGWVRIIRAHPNFVAALEDRGQVGRP